MEFNNVYEEYAYAAGEALFNIINNFGRVTYILDQNPAFQYFDTINDAIVANVSTQKIEGYTLFFPHITFLIDNKNKKVLHLYHKLVSLTLTLYFQSYFCNLLKRSNGNMSSEI